MSLIRRPLAVERLRTDRQHYKTHCPCDQANEIIATTNAPGNCHDNHQPINLSTNEPTSRTTHPTDQPTNQPNHATKTATILKRGPASKTEREPVNKSVSQ